MPRLPLAHLIVVLLALFVLGGCVSTESAPTRFYVLEALPADTAPLAGVRREPPLSVDLSAVRLPQYLDRPQIVTRVQPGRLELDEYNQWGDNPTKNVMRVLARNLSLLLGTSDVTLLTRRPDGPLDGRLDVDISQFERGPDGRVMLSAQWWLLSGREGAQAEAHVSDLAGEPLAVDAGVDATVAAMSDLLGRFSRIIAATLAQEAGR